VLIVLLGIALACYLLERVGVRAVFAAATSVGWGGFGILCLSAFAVFGLLGSAWYVLLPRASHIALSVLIRARMVRDAASEALPFSQVGGMILGVRAANLMGMPTRLAVGSMIVDVTTELLGQLLYVAFGLVLFLMRGLHSPGALEFERLALGGLVLAAFGGLVFLALQRHGFNWLSVKLAPRLFPASTQYLSGLGTELAHIHRAPLRVVLSVCIHFCDWNAAAVSTWIAFRLIGVHAPLSAVISLESLVYAARSVAFFVPNALGVQEAAYAVLAPLLGIGKEFALAVALLRRARDISVGIPILLIYQIAEGRRAVAAQVPTRP
jgi:putative membrane protein